MVCAGFCQLFVDKPGLQRVQTSLSKTQVRFSAGSEQILEAKQGFSLI
jgi:hypothetical protein